jgi:ABC-type sulfate/molybdate transport systems ATPase subunit
MTALTTGIAPRGLGTQAWLQQAPPQHGSAASLHLRGLQWGVGHWQSAPADLDLRPGQTLVLLGRNGAGKSALLDTLAGFLPARAGQVMLGQRDLAALAPEQRNIGYMFQRNTLFPHWTVERNLRFGRGAQADIDPLLDALALHPWLGHTPDQLSGGQRQRVALARALVGSPQLLLLDEPLSAIDPAARPALRRTLAALLRERRVTTVLVTHDARDARLLGDKVAVLEDGRLLQCGTAQAVFSRPVDLQAAHLVGVDNLWVLRVLRLARSGAHTVIDLGHEDAQDPVLRWQGELAPNLSLQPGQQVTLAVRAEFITPCAIAEMQTDTPAPPGVLQLAATLRESRCEGPLWRLDCTLPWGMQAHAFALPDTVQRLGLQSGDALCLRVQLQDMHLLAAT